MIKKLINIVLLTSFFLCLPIANEMVEETYWVHSVAHKVEPAQYKGHNIATTFQLKYKKKQFTITNLHVCRLPHKIVEKQRYDLNYKLLMQNKLPIRFKKLEDIDLVGQRIIIGDYPRKILAVDEFHDLCLLESNPNLRAFTLADDYELGELVRVIGFPRGLNKTIRKGRIFDADTNYFDWLHREVKYVAVTAIGYPGNSGSPVINKWGNVVGVLFAGSFFHTESMIVPLADLRNFVEINGY